jgi:hypothetical protein
MQFSYRLILVPCALILAFGAVSLQAQAPASGSADPCSLLPGPPADVQRDKGNCVGYFWPRVSTIYFRGLNEFGAMITIVPTASPSAAKEKIAVTRNTMSPVAYGDGGFEKLENPAANDPRTPTPDEVKNKSMWGDFSELTEDAGNYGARFACGAYAIYVFANPSKGVAARQLLAEMDMSLRSANLCGSTTQTAIAPAVPSVPAVTAPVTRADDDVPRGGSRYYAGDSAQRILAAKAAGSRYMVVVQRDWDAQQNCFVEVRGWVGEARASNDGQVSVDVGPTRAVCVRGAVVSVDQVNQSEGVLQSARDNMYKALKQKADLEPYLKDPDRQQWATTETQKVQQWIDYYQKIITATEQGLAGSVP